MSDKVLPPFTLDKEVAKNPLRFKCTLEGWSVSGFSSTKEDGSVLADISKGDLSFVAIVSPKLLERLRANEGEFKYSSLILEMVWMVNPYQPKQKFESWIPHLLSTI